MKCSPLVSTSAVVFFASGHSASAEVLLSQAPDRVEMYASQDDTGTLGNFATCYDDFTLATNSRITSISWLGGYFHGTQAPISYFTINIYTDDGGPSRSIASFYVPGSANEQDTHTHADLAEVYKYSGAVSFTARAGTEYWLSIEPTIRFHPQWGWATSNQGDGVSYQDFLGKRTRQKTDFAFSLMGMQATPEPSSLLVLGLPMLGLLLRRRSR